MAAAVTAAAAAPRVERVGKAWKVEHQEGRTDLVVNDTNPKQSVHIYKCSKSTVRVEGKVNEILLDNCHQLQLIFDDAISSVDIVNSTRCEVEAKGSTPSFVVDKSSGITLHLPVSSEGAQIITSNAMEINVMTSPKKDGGPPISHAVPQQFITKLVNGRLVTTPVQHATA